MDTWSGGVLQRRALGRKLRIYGIFSSRKGTNKAEDERCLNARYSPPLRIATPTYTALIRENVPKKLEAEVSI